MALRAKRVVVSPAGEKRGGKPRRRMVAPAVAVTVVLLSGLLVGAVWRHRGNGCTWTVICGRVNNVADSGMYATFTLAGGTLPDQCVVWNGGGGSARSDISRGCTPQKVPPGDSRGGRFSGEDVDAFTYEDRPYHLTIDDRRILVPRGVWTKISDLETATCRAPVPGTVECHVVTTG